MAGVALARADADLVRLVCTGMTDAEIARRLQASTHEVTDRLTKLLRRLGCGTRAELIALIATRGTSVATR